MARFPTPHKESSPVFFAGIETSGTSTVGREFLSVDQTMPGTRDVEPRTESS